MHYPWPGWRCSSAGCPAKVLEDNSQAIGGALGTLSLLYAVIVGSVMASGWNRFNAAQSSLNQEASNRHPAYGHAGRG